MIHPDDKHALDDWPIYGPRDVDISLLVEMIAAKGVRLSVIEDRIKSMLADWLKEIAKKDLKDASHD
ncbi:hypothetical protein K9U39_20660 [Rhodoblastus acidophilus]|uniref:Uncharacterized protein n=1 Tax=Candidatus Rhodoblastus alkanivorans TaxID=2954117 RepID=A0ABS9ZBM2_9HYPH|nr:hypothetical protein [Candidatus Rhodoblastus alkanivorans]MCI4680623.1 hypothetical protein [Candidatus Rhodoblastus alkanivorans]MCI4685058.1 hypothetical protein [Candidatus Rhodoblastus alkanivorans]MDI4643296.1 hypothetical protein [Rhodoblastus acidophilus]